MDYNKLEMLPISRNEFSRLEIFKNVQFEKLAGFLLGCKTITVEPKTKLIDPENPKRRLLILLEGSLQVNLESNGGQFSDIINPGHCAGEMSIFENIKPSALVEAKETCRLLVVPPDVAMAMIRASHELCLNFIQIMSQRLRNNH